jgi:hypothetical protein
VKIVPLLVAVAAVVVAAACPNGKGNGSGPVLSDTQGQDKPLEGLALLRDLEAEVIDGYDRDEPLDPQIRVIDPLVGPARIGVGPGDVWFGPQVGLGTSRWPLTTDRTTDLEVRSKKLEVHMADDQSAAWVSDEVSWRIWACERIAVIPLRFTALYVRDGDRWSSVLEHLSYGRPVAADDRADFGASIDAAEADPAIADKVDALLVPLLDPTRPTELSLAPEAFALGPDVWSEARSEEIAAAPLWPEGMRVETRRVGVVERGGHKPTVAYWAGTLIAARGDGAVRLRATIVFELRPIRGSEPAPPKPFVGSGSGSGAGERPTAWTIAQVHLSLPIDDPALASAAFGGALAGLNPLRVSCTNR